MSAAKHRDVRRMYCNPADFAGEYTVKCCKSQDPSEDRQWVAPVAVVDLRPEAGERLLEAGTLAVLTSNGYTTRGKLSRADMNPNDPTSQYAIARDQARAVLAAVLGRLPKKP